MDNIQKVIQKQIGTMFSGNFGALVLNLLFYPIISRLFDDASFAEYSIFLSLNILLSISGTLRLELEIPLTTSEEEAKKLSTTAIISWCFSALLYLIITTILHYIMDGNLVVRLAVLYLVVPASLFTTLLQIFTYNANKHGQFKTMSASKIILRIAQIATILGGYYFELFDNLLLVIAIITSNLASVIYMFFRSSKTFRYDVSTFYLSTIKSNFRYVSKVLPTDLVNILAQYMPVWLIVFWFDKSIAGQYAFALAILLIPVQLVTNSVSPVFYKTFHELPYRELLIVIWKKLFLIGVFPAVIATIFSSQLFTFCFGQEWNVASSIFQILCVTYLLLALSNSTSMVCLILKIEIVNLWFSIANTFLIVISLWVGNYYNDINIAIQLLAVFIGVETIVYNYYIYTKSSPNPDLNLN